MKRIYYIANSLGKYRLLRRFYKPDTARQECDARNTEAMAQGRRPGWQWGDWVTEKEYGKDAPREWTWQNEKGGSNEKEHNI